MHTLPYLESSKLQALPFVFLLFFLPIFFFTIFCKTEVFSYGMNKGIYTNFFFGKIKKNVIMIFGLFISKAFGFTIIYILTLDLWESDLRDKLDLRESLEKKDLIERIEFRDRFDF